jgi:hypothetical protein
MQRKYCEWSILKGAARPGLSRCPMAMIGLSRRTMRRTSVRIHAQRRDLIAADASHLHPDWNRCRQNVCNRLSSRKAVGQMYKFSARPTLRSFPSARTHSPPSKYPVDVIAQHKHHGCSQLVLRSRLRHLKSRYPERDPLSLRPGCNRPTLHLSGTRRISDNHHWTSID